MTFEIIHIINNTKRCTTSETGRIETNTNFSNEI